MEHVIIEVEEGSLTLTIAERDRNAIKIRVCRRVPINDLNRIALSSAMKTLISDSNEDLSAAHIILGERRFQHFTADVPRMGPDDLRAFVQREAHRLSSTPADVELLGHCWQIKRLPSKRRRIAAMCLAQTAWDPIERAVTENGLHILSLTSIEDAISAAIPRALPPRTAVLEVSAGKARLILTEDRAIVQARRFVLPTGFGDDDDTSMLTAQLAMEVPRTLDYLEEIGCQTPEALLVSHRVPLEDDEIPAFDESLSWVRFEPTFELEMYQAMPSLATVGLLRRLIRGSRQVSMLSGITIDLPRSPWPFVTATLAVMVGSAGSATALLEYRDAARVSRTHASMTEAAHALEQSIDRQRGEQVAEVPLLPAQSRLLELLNTRRPHSLLLSRIANSTTSNVTLDSLEFSDDDSVIIAGRIFGESRLLSLQAFTEFMRELQSVAFLEDDGREQIRNLEPPGSGLGFRVRLHWRLPS